MLRHALARLLWMVPTLLGITLLTFLLLDLVPLDRAEVEVAHSELTVDREAREAAVEALRVRYGFVDPDSGEPRTAWQRYVSWLGHALRWNFAPPDEDPVAFGRRFGSAAAVSMLLGVLAIAVCLLVGIPLGAWCGHRAGGVLDRAVSAALLVGYGVPEFLIATLLLLAFGGGFGEAWLHASGLRSPGSSSWPLHEQLGDLAQHLVLPVATLSLAPLAIVARHVREAVRRVGDSDWVQALRGFGVAESEVRARILRNALSTTVTRAGVIVPALLVGSVVVEQVFTLPGLGRLGLQAVIGREVSAVMAVTLFSAVLVLLSLLASDLLLKRLDPRVRLR